jgi:hypothetical protein
MFEVRVASSGSSRQSKKRDVALQRHCEINVT